jgi:hypothetical protein
MLWVFGAYLSHMRSMPVEASRAALFRVAEFFASTRTVHAGIRFSGGEYQYLAQMHAPLA